MRQESILFGRMKACWDAQALALSLCTIRCSLDVVTSILCCNNMTLLAVLCHVFQQKLKGHFIFCCAALLCRGSKAIGKDRSGPLNLSKILNECKNTHLDAAIVSGFWLGRRVTANPAHIIHFWDTQHTTRQLVHGSLLPQWRWKTTGNG